ncbi:MAG TPA: LysR family transcriptional regulator [Xanthobacteraceae bacterium]|nr:LysR family transcriptional regulator [Xanthobacteraceae bacterium]
MRRLSLDHLQTFADVVSLGSFSAAARRRNLTQPAVSLHIKQLEARLGVRLIERIGRRAHPTAAGRDLIGHVQRVDAAVAGALAAVADHRDGGTGRLRLGTGATACIHLLPPVLRALRQKFPALEIVVSTGNTPGILAALEDNAIDVALVTLPAPGRNFQAVWTRADELRAIFPPGTGAVPTRVTAAYLAGRPLVLYEAGGHARRVIDDWFTRAGLLAKPIMELGSVEAIKKLVGAGMGCAVLPQLALAGRAADKLVSRPLSPRLYRTLGLVLRRDKQLDRGLRAFIKAVAAAG